MLCWYNKRDEYSFKQAKLLEYAATIFWINNNSILGIVQHMKTRLVLLCW